RSASTTAAVREDVMKKYRMICLAFALGLPFALAPMSLGTASAQAAEIRLLCSNGLREVMEVLAPQFERASGHKLVISFGLAAALEATIVKGEAEIGILPLSEILPEHGVELIGPFPAEVQGYIVMTAAISANAKQAGPARDLIKHLTAPAAIPVIKAKGMEPG